MFSLMKTTVLRIALAMLVLGGFVFFTDHEKAVEMRGNLRDYLNASRPNDSAKTLENSQVSRGVESIVGKWSCQSKGMNDGAFTESQTTVLNGSDGTFTENGTVTYTYPETETHYGYEESITASGTGTYRIFDSTIVTTADEYSITRWESAGENLLADPERRSVVRDIEAGMEGVTITGTIMSLTAEESIVESDGDVVTCKRV